MLTAPPMQAGMQRTPPHGMLPPAGCIGVRPAGTTPLRHPSPTMQAFMPPQQHTGGGRYSIGPGPHPPHQLRPQGMFTMPSTAPMPSYMQTNPAYASSPMQQTRAQDYMVPVKPSSLVPPQVQGFQNQQGVCNQINGVGSWAPPLANAACSSLIPGAANAAPWLGTGTTVAPGAQSGSSCATSPYASPYAAAPTAAPNFGASSSAPGMVFIAFGDSLTTGVQGDGSNPHPYTKKLQQMLGPQAQVINEGKTSSKAAEMAPRLQSSLNSKQPRATHVALLGGTNDLIYRQAPEAIAGHLRDLYGMIRAAGATVIAVTVPPLGPKSTFHEARGRINDEIRKMAAAGASGAGATPIILADLDEALMQLSQPQRNALFSDTVHFNVQGYDFIGDVIYAAIQQSLVARPGQPV